MNDFSPEHRAQAIYSTEAAAACGVSDKTTPAQLWAKKLGRTEDDDLSNVLPVRLGKVCEPGVIQLYQEDTGHDVRRLNDMELITKAPGFPMGSHFDARNMSTNMLVECKFFGIGRLKEFGAPGSDDVPMDVLVQSMHEMAVYNACATNTAARVNGVEVVVVFGNVQMQTFVIPWDQGAIDMLHRKEAEFWALVQTETPPEPKTIEDARQVWAKTDGSVVEASPDAVAAFEALVGIRAQLKGLAAQDEALKAWLMKFMGPAAVLRAGSRVLTTWNATKGAKRIDGKALREKYPEVAAMVEKIGEPGRQFLVKD